MAIIENIPKTLFVYVSPARDDADVELYNAKAFCQQNGIRLIAATEGDLDVQLGRITGIAEEIGLELKEDCYTTDKPLPENHLFIFGGLDATSRNGVLKAMSEAALGKGALKAMVTENNLNWTLRHILIDVAEEHEIMSAYVELHKTVQIMDVLIETVGLPPQAKEAFDERMKLAKAITETGNVPPDANYMNTLVKELKFLITLGEEDEE